MDKTWRYHPTKPPKLVDMEDEETLERMHSEGWRDTPAAFEDKHERDEGSEPQLTEEQKALLTAFREDPKSLTKDEMVLLGKGFDLKLMKAWKEPTLIAKLQEHLDGDDQTAN